MKKLLAIVCLLLMAAALIFPADAAEAAQAEDSSTIPGEILARLPLKKGDEVVRVYSIPIFSSFANFDSIEAIVNYATTSYCVRSADGTYAAYRLRDGECIRLKNNFWSRNAMEAYLAGQIIKHIDPNIVVENTYFLSGDYAEGSAIYYKTNRGDYVLYSTKYLFSAEAFFAYQRTVYNEDVVTCPDGPPIGGPMRGFWDLSAYDFTSETFDPHAEFPMRSITAAYRKHGRLLGYVALDIGLTAAVILLSIVLLGQKRPRLLCVKVWQFLLIFLVISGCLLLADQLCWGGVLTRDFTSSFLEEGMTQNQVNTLIGNQKIRTDMRFSYMMACDLPFDEHFYIVLDEDDSVCSIYESERTYPLRGWLLPALLAEIALLEAVIYLILRKQSRGTVDRARCILAVRLLLIFLGIVLVANALDLYVLPTYFPEYYVHEGMTNEELFEFMQGSARTLDDGVREYDLLSGKVLTVESESHYQLGSKVISCRISGFGDSSCLRFVLPFTIAAAAVAELVVYLFLRKRIRQIHQ